MLREDREERLHGTVPLLIAVHAKSMLNQYHGGPIQRYRRPHQPLLASWAVEGLQRKILPSTLGPVYRFGGLVVYRHGCSSLLWYVE